MTATRLTWVHKPFIQNLWQIFPRLSPSRMIAGIPRRRLWLAFSVLLTGLTLTLLSSLYIKLQIETAAVKEFEFICNEIQTNISDRLEASALVLYSGAALFYASEKVDRSEWKIFTSKLRLEQQIPGTQAIGYAQIIPADQLDSHIQQIRAEGFPDYTVRPPGPRDVYTSIVYIEPFSGRNMRAFGFDMYSEPVRRAAMERARDENIAALSGKVTLVQETDQDIQAGVLMYVPVYQPGLPTSTLAERRAAILGWAYSPYRMNDMMAGTLGTHTIQWYGQQISLQIYDGEEAAPDHLLYDSRSEEEKSAGISSQDTVRTSPVRFFGQIWTLRFIHRGSLSSLADLGSFWLVLGGGTSISLLLFGLILSMLKTAYYLESIKSLAETDALTGVYNRRKILELAESELVRARRMRHNLTLAMIDLNYFKRINDTYGHAVGDQALRLTASAFRDTLRKDLDRIGRFGGDEFILVLPETSLTQCEPLCSRLRAVTFQRTTGIAPGMPAVTLSIGAAQFDAQTPSIRELIEKADLAMYVDKKERRQ